MAEMTQPNLFLKSGASISACGQYRYDLERRWDPTQKPQVFIMLNPSTADASVDDPTIRRCMAFAKREGAGGIYVANLFALRATDPRELLSADDPIGAENVRAIGDALLIAAIYKRPAIVAWGAHQFAKQHGLDLPRRARDIGAKLVCLGTTKDGSPRHPLYVKADAPLVEWPRK
jgi:hypothetical protein